MHVRVSIDIYRKRFQNIFWNLKYRFPKNILFSLFIFNSENHFQNYQMISEILLTRKQDMYMCLSGFMKNVYI